MTIQHKFDSADMPEIRRTRTRLLKYFKLNYKATRSERIASAICPDVDWQKLGITVNIMDRTTKVAINKLADSVKAFQTAMSAQLEDLLFSAASSHYNSAVDECQSDLFEPAFEMAEKYWDRMTSKPKPTKIPAKTSQNQPKSTPKHATKTPSKSAPNQPAKPSNPVKSPSLPKQVTRPSAPKSTSKTPMSTSGLSSKSAFKSTTNSQPKSTIKNLRTSASGPTKPSPQATKKNSKPKTTSEPPSTQSTMKGYFQTTKSSKPSGQTIFPSSSTFNFSKKPPTKPFRN